MDRENMKKLDNNNFRIIPRNELEEVLSKFIPWSGSYLVRLFSEFEKKIYPIGSGGLIKYNKRYFLVTNYHVIKNIEMEHSLKNLNMPYKDKRGIDRKASFVKHAVDIENDLAAFEISPITINNIYDHSFLEGNFFEKDVPNYFDNYSNVVLAHGYPSTETFVNHEALEVNQTTLPYLTFIKGYDQISDSLELYAEKVGVTITTYSGMSGSLVYGYYPEDDNIFKCLGILTLWSQIEETLTVFPIHDLLNFLDVNFSTDN